MPSIQLPRFCDLHCHLREGDLLPVALAETARYCQVVLAMPNLKTPLVHFPQVMEYKQAIDDILAGFPSPMRELRVVYVLYVNDQMSPEDIRQAAAHPDVVGAKLYPANATTNSAAGARDPLALGVQYDAMEKEGLPLLIHAEDPAKHIDPFDREAAALDGFVGTIVERHPDLKVVVEHITTARAVDFVQSARAKVAATITPHHLERDRRAIFDGGLQADEYCLPLLKRTRDRDTLRAAATSGSPKFFLGTDSAPHLAHDKHKPCGCAGVFNAKATPATVIDRFASADALDKLTDFVCHHGARFYDLDIDTTPHLTFNQKAFVVPEGVHLSGNLLRHWRFGEKLHWQLQDEAA